jgi:hypothetical protein
MSGPGPTRLRPVPAMDGPYDDELTERTEPPMTGALALDYPPATTSAVPLRLVPPACAPPAPGSDSTAVMDPRPWSHRLAQAVAEVLAGDRPPAQLGPHTSLDVLALLERWSGRFGQQPRAGQPRRRPRVASVHVGRPTTGVAEVCAVVDTGPRRRAIALRLETVAGHWRCTELQVG